LKLVNISLYRKLTLSRSRECVIGAYVHLTHARTRREISCISKQFYAVIIWVQLQGERHSKFLADSGVLCDKAGVI